MRHCKDHIVVNTIETAQRQAGLVCMIDVQTQRKTIHMTWLHQTGQLHAADRKFYLFYHVI